MSESIEPLFDSPPLCERCETNPATTTVLDDGDPVDLCDVCSVPAPRRWRIGPPGVICRGTTAAGFPCLNFAPAKSGLCYRHAE